MRILFAVLSFAVAVGSGVMPVSASCSLLATNCSTDSRGSSYVTEQNLGGGYNTYKNGSLYSQTQQNLSGGYTEEFTSGGYRTYNYDPYASTDPQSSSWPEYE